MKHKITFLAVLVYCASFTFLAYNVAVNNQKKESEKQKKESLKNSKSFNVDELEIIVSIKQTGNSNNH